MQARDRHLIRRILLAGTLALCRQLREQHLCECALVHNVDRHHQLGDDDLVALAGWPFPCVVADPDVSTQHLHRTDTISVDIRDRDELDSRHDTMSSLRTTARAAAADVAQRARAKAARRTVRLGPMLRTDAATFLAIRSSCFFKTHRTASACFNLPIG